MGHLSAEQIHWLETTFGDRMTTRRVERKLYSHDVGEMPLLIKPLIGTPMADAIVQPESEAEIVALVKWAAANHIPLTPRGKATSGYGGVLPVKGGVVIDFFRMAKVLHVDVAAQTATLQPGIVWENADRELKKHGMTLRTYPSSYPSATAGGWLAQGGAGYGAFEAGWFRDNVISARVVLGNGEVGMFDGEGLDMIYEAEGITGIITEMTIKIMPEVPLDILSIGCPDAHELQHLLEGFMECNLPIWSMHFINPRMAALKNQAPPMMHQGHPVEKHIELPETYITTIAVRQTDSEMVRAKLAERMNTGKCKATLLSDEIAQHEWANRFRIMTVKRLGPSLVPAEVVVPLSGLGAMLSDVETKIAQPVVKEGVLIRQGRNPKGEPEVVILGFIPADQRKLSYNFVFPLSLTIARIAEKYGGRPYATGLYYSKMAPKILGAERARVMKEFKAKADPAGILNPGKVIGNALISNALIAANAFEPLLRPFGNAVSTDVGEKFPDKPVRGIPADVAWYAYACSQCGYCVQECDQYYGRGWESQSPRGKWYWLREFMEGREKWDQFMVDTFLVCTTCELCNLRCSASLPIESSWMKLRGKLIHEDGKMTFPPFEMMAAALTDQGNIWAGYRRNRDAWFPEDLREKHSDKKAKAVYFAGCTVSYVEHDIGQASVRLLDEAGVDFTYVGKKENCCGTPMLVAGKWDVFVETMKKNIAAVKATGADTVITSCPACNMMWRHVYPEWCEKLGIEYGITARHYSEVVAEKVRDGSFTFPEAGVAPVTVTWHDSCHIGRVSHVYEEPREIIKAIPGVNYVDMEYNRDAAHCCGSVLTLIKEPPVAAEVGKHRLDEAIEAGAQKVLAACPCCEFQFRVARDKKNLDIEIVDLARFCAEALGYTDLPDPHPEVKAQWAVFEAMIALMTPQGFADLMGTMWPELIDAMPFGMGKMMRAMGKIPGALELMKPLFPVLFPKLLPLMMPKVMDTMLARVAAQIPMPDYMAEQMPDLMPKVMDNLMPHMIGDVVPLVTEPMIAYLKGS
ncbi:MAG TPA: FAD-binding and (Fe-S)-binding domain-containing protein [Anaerolineae bacterium]|nr:FAD-binding and (Fe-S)-binding domain-containing protein [Anaerolineae bacterium]HQK15459.1 FAD-binding and (Fe-S)-binding domain-containing protein [Anaerolineae bacterium]